MLVNCTPHPVSVPLRGLYPYKLAGLAASKGEIRFQSPCGDYTLIRLQIAGHESIMYRLESEVSVPLRGLYPYKVVLAASLPAAVFLCFSPLAGIIPL